MCSAADWALRDSDQDTARDVRGNLPRRHAGALTCTSDYRPQYSPHLCKVLRGLAVLKLPNDDSGRHLISDRVRTVFEESCSAERAGRGAKHRNKFWPAAQIRDWRGREVLTRQPAARSEKSALTGRTGTHAAAGKVQIRLHLGVDAARHILGSHLQMPCGRHRRGEMRPGCCARRARLMFAPCPQRVRWRTRCMELARAGKLVATPPQRLRGERAGCEPNMLLPLSVAALHADCAVGHRGRASGSSLANPAGSHLPQNPYSYCLDSRGLGTGRPGFGPGAPTPGGLHWVTRESCREQPQSPYGCCLRRRGLGTCRPGFVPGPPASGCSYRVRPE